MPLEARHEIEHRFEGSGDRERTHAAGGKGCTEELLRGADEVIEEVASFPNGDHDDFCDSMTMALMRFRQGGFISLNGEEFEDDPPRKMREYY